MSSYFPRFEKETGVKMTYYTEKAVRKNVKNINLFSFQMLCCFLSVMVTFHVF